ncbi:restriction endonuclease subunit S [Bacteroides thetaiotaomicron]|jgi:type I restriction enzyme S subunit|uniref:restriction endonuclease subunit S n=1 Tax=Bacteroides thetaiotaomicron TaxID=818 RepID=UPI00232D6B20|nr:restriction endonuclease subunit S [Bacteroides thetaiotaomicron]MDC2131846.1 restriction endonuclease subunit S [Bacteroides thetaiotaomicron]MDC2136408.1 restriction endonuclease subunit S [Bacteroides thetaiotaomicron]MDC2150319.1 restriction endonuclease subunit S [Bacteroides thetaiotaomicron]
MDTKALRQKILDLAIHGKLVPQDPNDEPASVLLERIKAEKERLIKEGKIKRSKKSAKTSDTPHYENVPFEVPSSWVWCKLEDYVKSVTDGDHQAPPKSDIGIPFLVISDVAKGKLNFLNTRFVPQEYYEKISFDRKPEKGDLLFTVTGSYGIVVPVNIDCKFCFQRHIGLIKTLNTNEYLLHLLKSSYIKGQCDEFATGTAQKTVGLETLRSFLLPIPPFAEQQRIVIEIEKWFSLIELIEGGKDDLQTTIKQAKSKILDLAIHGKLVPQDPNEEPAIKLLKRINPDFTPCDNGHYTQLPDGWTFCRLDQIIGYEQPTAYIVESTAYDDSYSTPVLTAGKSFIIGYTNEATGIYSNLPCIIFDDFTTDSKLVDFPFKVKSSAMKILKVHKDIEVDYVAMFMSITKLVGDTHKRYWISEYSKLEIPIPSKAEQKRIIHAIHGIFTQLDLIMESL